jgi:hypothetical protein
MPSRSSAIQSPPAKASTCHATSAPCASLAGAAASSRQRVSAGANLAIA